MSTLLLTHPSSLEHDTGPGHPERIDRIKAIQEILDEEQFASLVREVAPAAQKEHILSAHPQNHIDSINNAIPTGGVHLIDGDTVLCPKSLDAIYHAAGSGVAAVDKVMSGEVKNAFCALRPPGHHAEKERAMGFCFFNNIAIAAYYAREKYGCERVAVVDFDVHHGNGTQDIFWDEPDMFYGSTHESPLYPGSGSRSETGAGNIFNVPLSGGSGPKTFREGFESGILVPLKEFSPDFVFISAGFDAHVKDPLSTLALLEDDFAWATLKLIDVADSSASGRVVSMLEGGYDLQGLADSVAVHVAALMGAGS